MLNFKLLIRLDMTALNSDNLAEEAFVNNTQQVVLNYVESIGAFWRIQGAYKIGQQFCWHPQSLAPMWPKEVTVILAIKFAENSL